jgi:nicotinamidase-related amidase
MPAVELPEIPAPVAVDLDPAKTALLVLDISATSCPPPCRETVVPAVAALLEKARRAGALVAWTHGESSAPNAPGLEQKPGEPVASPASGNKFFKSDLDEILQQRGIDTAIMVGIRANSAVMYTAMEANLRGYTVVVAEDGIFSTDFGTFVARYQLLNHGGPSMRNPDNTPLAKSRTTLSRSDLITFKQ